MHACVRACVRACVCVCVCVFATLSMYFGGGVDTTFHRCMKLAAGGRGLDIKLEHGPGMWT